MTYEFRVRVFSRARGQLPVRRSTTPGAQVDVRLEDSSGRFREPAAFDFVW
jgi:hypothetical protein